MRAALALCLAACATSPMSSPTDPPAAPGGKADSAFEVHGARGWYLIGDALTPGDDRIDLTIDGPADTGVVDVWLDQRYAGRATGGDGTFAISLDLSELAVGEHQLLFAADLSRFAFAEVRFQRSHPLYVAVTNDWDDPDHTDDKLERQERLHARHPALVVTHFVGPYTFTAPNVSPARRALLTSWVNGMAEAHGDEIGLHIHPWCNFVESAGVTCRTAPSFARASDSSGYTVILSSYTEPELEQMFAHARALFVANGLPAPTSFRAGGWTAELHVLEALGAQGFVADSSGCNWARIEEWEHVSGAALFPWNRDHWAPIDDTSQPYYPSTDDLLADHAPTLPVLELPDNGALVDYVTADEMIDVVDANWPAHEALAGPRVVTIGYHPVDFSEAFFERIDGALTEIDRHLAVDGLGPIVYARASDLPRVFPRP